MTVRHEDIVSDRFDTLHSRFKPDVPADDVRLRALLNALGPARGRRVLDLGCGKGRFAVHLRSLGARVVGLDLSAAMLTGGADGLDRIQGSARRLPFASETFDAVVAVEMLEHVHASGIDDVLAEAARVLRPGGVVAIVDKNAGALNAQRPWLPGLAVKWIDQKRGRWMYPADAPARERWFWPEALRKRLRRDFVDVRVEHLLSTTEADRRVFRLVPGFRLMTLWSARLPGGTRE